MQKIHEHLFDGLDAILKTCSKCNKSLPESCFSNASGGNYRRSECRKCEKELAKSRNAIKRSVALPPADHVCPICQRDASQVIGEGGKKSGMWCCDHNHTTNKFRGWLCHSCNRGIGNMKDSVDVLKAALVYLEKHNGT